MPDKKAPSTESTHNWRHSTVHLLLRVWSCLQCHRSNDDKYLRAVALSVEVDRPPTNAPGLLRFSKGNIPTSLMKLLGRWRSVRAFDALLDQCSC
ncbi:unnamed protein product [Cylindrotheca closterium]|uniref:Uncharacterized protein n=1 Tax=Cylindrotheca closterium TaxID=2856 RepID=A0AAD2FNM6_9STRA|nr:unnamed protein product [Cylindrotheca closterium]